MMQYSDKSFWLIVALLLVLVCSYAAFASEELTDVQRKQVIYEMYEDYKKSFPEVPDIDPKAAMKLLKSPNVVFVDSRESKEQKVSMLPRAVPEKQFMENLDRYKDYIIIGYCTISYRSGKLAQKLRKKGIVMLNLKGGLLAWVHEGGEVYDQHGKTKRIHVYGKKWNYPPKGYEAVW